MVGMNYKQLPRNFVNCYVTNGYEIIMTFDTTENYDVIFATYLDRVARDNRYYAGHDIFEDEVVLYFKVPDRFKKDFDTYATGRYSKFSDAYKKVIKDFFGNRGLDDDTHEVNEVDIIQASDKKRKKLAEYLGDI
jgi:hypothetical protein